MDSFGNIRTLWHLSYVKNNDGMYTKKVSLLRNDLREREGGQAFRCTVQVVDSLHYCLHTKILAVSQTFSDLKTEVNHFRKRTKFVETRVQHGKNQKLRRQKFHMENFQRLKYLTSVISHYFQMNLSVNPIVIQDTINPPKM